MDKLIPNRKVAYFTGCFANYYYPEAGQATVHILERNGVKIIVPDQVCCGLPMIAKGNTAGTRRNIERNIKELDMAVSDGYALITTCSSCALMVRRSYPQLLKGEQADRVARNFYHISEYLLKLHDIGMLNTDFQPVNQTVYYHTPCHLRSLEIKNPTVKLLQLIPGVNVKHISEECCGMGGAYGYEKVNYTLSREIAARLWAKIKANPTDRIVTDCGGCKLQIERGTGLKVDHPMILLREAYGLGEGNQQINRSQDNAKYDKVISV